MKKTNLTLAETNGAMEMLMARIFVEQNGILSENDKKSLKHVVGLCVYLLDISKRVEEVERGDESECKILKRLMKNLTDFQEDLYGSIF